MPNDVSNGIFFQTSPAHFPCAPITAPSGQPLHLGPSFGWANALPDANAQVDFVINGTKVTFSGVGYHDKVSIPASDTHWAVF